MVEGAHRQVLVRLIAEHVGEPRSGVEVGVHKGRTSALLLRSFAELDLWLVDKWDDIEIQKTSQRAIDFANGRRHAIWGDSVASARLVPAGMDFTFIDADHTRAGCAGDMMAYWPLVREGGLFCGHDYNKPDFPGVTEAVKAFGELHGIEFQGTEVGHIWWTIKRTKS